ncbi:hypothetical protein ASPVEDRAFT_33433 [Aspergillus versicolor CBS 583.65]|uniref:Uncharacterized protein n=1 Tax=Aspergillus versicolor CBS 583.65 TaxID=1036611 RepID=A0A1L9Q0B1_ASPVE|nr:uncharacterized protein ASPVEDRAFT_33433 [Aspergillus versicolor CBS 583.65]OJJ07201.1 hypothetical protein ASPVEDRAFT_33433 [Aspergillus versicolor CBS 583.65]
MALENLQPFAYAVISIAFALGTGSILLRLYCRWRLRAFGRDDAAAIFLFLTAKAVNNVQQAILYVFLQHGCGFFDDRPADKAPDGILKQINTVISINPGIKTQIAVMAVNLPALKSLFTTVVGSSHEASGYSIDRYIKAQGGHRLGSLPSHSRGQGTWRGRRFASRMSGEGDLGGTLTGSEEEFVRQRDKNVDKIQVVTDVEIVSQYSGDDNGNSYLIIRRLRIRQPTTYRAIFVLKRSQHDIYYQGDYGGLLDVVDLPIPSRSLRKVVLPWVDMDFPNMEADEDIIDIFGAAFDSDLEMLRRWATGVNQTARHTDDEITQDELADLSTDITQGHVSEYASDQHDGDGTVNEQFSEYAPDHSPGDSTVDEDFSQYVADYSPGEGTVNEDTDSDSRRVDQYFYFYGNSYDPETIDCSQVDAFSQTYPVDPAEEELANILGDMRTPTVRNGGAQHWAAGWESLPPGDLPGPSARSSYATTYPAPVNNINPALLDLSNSTSGPSQAQATQAQATQDHQPVESPARLKMKTCESCQKHRSHDFEVYKYVIPKGASHDGWVKAVGNFCLLNGPVCPYCRISIPDTTPVGPLLVTSDEWLQSIVQ